MTIREALAEGSSLLGNPSSSSFIDTPGLDAELLLTEIMRLNRAEFIAHGSESITRKENELYLRLLERRRNGECVAYILGHREFRGLEFTVNPNVLVPRPDTETLVEAALEYIDFWKQTKGPSQQPNCLTLLDLCTGSGAIAVALKNERPFLSVCASDISAEAIQTARFNAERFLKDSISFVRSDLFENIIDKYDIIVSNPPYVPSGVIETLAPEVRREPRLALDGGSDGLELIRKIISASPDHLFPGGVIIFEASPEQMPVIRHFLETGGFNSIRIHRDLSGKERVISAKSDT